MAPADGRFLRACRRQTVDKTPVWFMRQAGRYMKEYRELRRRHSILKLAKTPKLACEVTLQPARAMPVDAAIIFADILLPVEPMGVRLAFKPGPRLSPAVRSAADVERLRDFDPASALGFVPEAIRLCVERLGPTPLIGFAGAPFTLASYLIEGQPSAHFIRTKTFMQAQPKAWDKLMRKIRRITADYLCAQVAAGASAVQLFDSWIGALSPEQYRGFVRPHSAYVIEEVRRRTAAPVIHFGTGTSGFLEDFAQAGGEVIGVDWRIDLGRAFRRLGPSRAVQGNLDPVMLLGPKAALRSEVFRLLEQAKNRRGFIFNLGHGILPETPFENVAAVVDWVHRGLD
ncbi:MAG: uroporphyrinogen decarboxylase [Elusimicrobia bacterium]|nr:uroporphyrinogen decarboxylase [Elusimicrobiota bacterium]MDE2425406.1 uroporphyrinogen decarboxylase [Elusimicrobiota bacterium]